MNTIKLRSALVCALIAGVATSGAFAMDAAGMEKHRADKQERQEQKQEQRQERNAEQSARQEQRYANNPPPRQAPPAGAPPASAPPASAPPRQGPPPRQAQPSAPPSGRGNGGSYNRGGNDNRVVVGPPRGDSSRGDVRIVPPKYYNRPGNDHSPGNGNGYGNGHNDNSHNGNSHSGNGRPPHYVSHLPSGYHRHYWNGNPYYYHSGHWYRPYGSQFVVVTAPYGLFVPYLPYYSSFWYGSSRYFYSDGVYYNYEPVRRGYVVAQSPYEEEAADTGEATDEDLYIYPAQGQSAQQQADDKYECHSWAVDQTQYDPVESDYDAARRSDYIRAITACLTGRGYTVR